jgi:hypothetical protein
VEIDHVFILCDRGAPGAGALLRLGLREGSGNAHPGQGTACRRFFFANAYLELLWVEDEGAAGRAPVRRTRLLDRWALRRAGACPFGVIVRPTVDEIDSPAPFPAWRYALPGPSIDVADGTPLSEPGIFYSGSQGIRGWAGREPIDHAIPATTLRAAAISGPVPEELSAAGRALVAAGAVALQEAAAYTLTLDFCDAPEATADLRPDLPLVLRWPRL